MTPLASDGGSAVFTGSWPQWPAFDQSTIAACEKVIRSGRWTLSAPSRDGVSFERRFAEAFAQFNNVPYCTPTSSGTAALIISLQALELKRSSEVLIPGLTCVAVALAVLISGAKPVFVDVVPNSASLSISDARTKITRHTAAIIIVHPYGNIVDIEAWLDFAKEFKLAVIEDCAQAHGATYHNRKAGTFGLMGCFSFQNSKLLTCGEGGAVITHDKKIYNKIEQLRAHGRTYRQADKEGQFELIENGSLPGQNYCMSEFHAAVLLDRLGSLESEVAQRRKNSNLLNHLLAENKLIRPGIVWEDFSKQACFGYLLYLSENPLPVDQLQILLSAELNFDFQRTYLPLNRHSLFNKLFRQNNPFINLPGAALAYEKLLIIPHHILLEPDSDKIALIVSAIEKVSQHIVESF